MTDDGHAPTEPWYRASPKNLAIFALIWSGEAFLILKFVTWVTHGSAALYLLMIPWTLFGSIIAVRPNWITRMTRVFEGELGPLIDGTHQVFRRFALRTAQTVQLPARQTRWDEKESPSKNGTYW